MAVVQSPLHSEKAIGSLESICFSIHKGTQCARLRSQPTNPQSTRQLAVRANLATQSRDWATLDQAERDAWGVYAAAHPGTDAFGNPQTLSGFSWFIALSTMMLDIGVAVVDTPPTVAAPASPAAVVATPGAGTVSIAFTAGAATTKINLWLYGPHSVGRLPKLAQAVHNVYGPGETTPLVIADLAAGYYTAWIRFVSETDGQTSTFVKFTFTVT